MLSHHRRLLEASAISLEVAAAAHVRSVASVDELPESLRWVRNAPGLLFWWRSVDGVDVPQYRPDVPVEGDDGQVRKYIFPTGAGAPVNVHPAMVDRITSSSRLVIVEGTKQYLAAVSAAPADAAVVGIAGCWGWSREGVAVPDLLRMVPVGGEVVVIFDADIATNRAVHDAASRLAETLTVAGVGLVRWVMLPASGKAGLDDFLAGMPDRPAALRNLLDRAVEKLPRRPKAAPATGATPTEGPARFFDEFGLKAEALRKAVRERLHLAVDQAGRIVVYEAGVYRDGRHAVTHAVSELLGDQYRQMHLRSLLEPLEAELHAEGRLIPEWPTRPVVNLRNGLLDPLTGELHPHTPDHLSLVQLPIEWDPAATCPQFDAWLDEMTDGRGDDLLEAVAQVLDSRGTRQRKAVMLFGPTRSGKSTFTRLLERIVGPHGCSAVTLHELTGDRFACADLYGKVLNSANEVKASHVDDLSTFKQVTGDDPVRAQFKYGRAFVFHCRALFLFTGNEVPTVGEVSGAYLARVRPYVFPHSFEGREDPTLEQRLAGELPGVLVRLVQALRRFEARGNYVVDDAATGALADFARRSDRVRLFIHETCEADPAGFTMRSTLFEAFEEWARQNRRQTLGRHRFFESVATAGYRFATRRGDRGFVGLTLLPQSEWGGPVDDTPEPATPARPQGAEGADHSYSRFTSVSNEGEEQRDSESHVRAGLAEPAPSAPSTREVLHL